MPLAIGVRYMCIVCEAAPQRKYLQTNWLSQLDETKPACIAYDVLIAVHFIKKALS